MFFLYTRLLIQLVRRFHKQFVSLSSLLIQLGQIYFGLMFLHPPLLIQLFRRTHMSQFDPWLPNQQFNAAPKQQDHDVVGLLYPCRYYVSS